MNQPVFDDCFGPWSSVPAKNRWNDVKIGRMDQWYDLISCAFHITSDSPAPAAPAEPERSSSKAASAQSVQNATTKQSKIPTKVRPQILASVQTIESPRCTVAERIVPPELCQARPAALKYEPRDDWDDPRPFDMFLASPQFGLQPWPQRAVPLDEAIARVRQQTALKMAEPTGKAVKKGAPRR
jgi:ATP-dependent exoDNAse (exonuclease V) beta subunit